MTQSEMFDDDAHLSIQQRFLLFHAAHPDVYALFKRFAFELRAAGRRCYGAKSLFERIRWHYATTSAKAGDFKLNNVFSSRYARLLIAECPQFDGFFELRRLRAL